MKSVRFSKVVEKSGRPEVYLLMSETDPEFHKALEADKIMSLSDESHGSGAEYGTVGYVKKRHGQLLLFPKSLKSFVNAKIVGIKYDMLAEDQDGDKKPEAGAAKRQPSRSKEVRPKAKPKQKQAKAGSSKKKKADSNSEPRKLIPFPAKVQEEDDDEEWKGNIRQAMRALEKGNSVAAYNILKRIVP